jgi:hypothetical protein
VDVCDGKTISMLQALNQSVSRYLDYKPLIKMNDNNRLSFFSENQVFSQKPDVLGKVRGLFLKTLSKHQTKH